jgi:hypothetical protein
VKQFTIMSYNVGYMKNLFQKDNPTIESEERIKCIGEVVKTINPHILGIVEASNQLNDHFSLLEKTQLNQHHFQILQGYESRGEQDLAIYYREPFEVESVDTHVEFYDSWLEDIDSDDIKELCYFERKPLEVMFKIKNSNIRCLLILILAKSKGVSSVNDVLNYQRLAVANRKKLYAQSKKIRERLDQIMINDPDLPVILMGDMNDEPGLDEFQKKVGASSIETLLGSVFEPEKILHNTLWHLKDDEQNKEIWTTSFEDPIVANRRRHRAWTDHILITPNLLKPKSPLKYVKNSGEIFIKNQIAKKASDHFPVFCKLETD